MLQDANGIICIYHAFLQYLYILYGLYQYIKVSNMNSTQSFHQKMQGINSFATVENQYIKSFDQKISAKFLVNSYRAW